MKSFGYPCPRLAAAATLLALIGCRHWAPNRYAQIDDGCPPNPHVAHMDHVATDVSAGLHLEFDDLRARVTHMPSTALYPSLYEVVAGPPGYQLVSHPTAPMPMGPGHFAPPMEPIPGELPFDPSMGFDPQRPALMPPHEPWWSRMRPSFRFGRGPSRHAGNDRPSVVTK